MRCHFIHGIRTSADSAVTGLLRYLPPDSAYPDYGWEWEGTTRIVNPAIVGTMQPYVEDGDVLIGHSNGCPIIYELLQRGVTAAGVVFINGALETDFTLPASVGFADVYFNAGDEITEIARVGAALGVTDCDWGELGHRGYTGAPDSRIANIDCGNTVGMPIVSGHSDFFTPAKIAFWGPYLANRIRGHFAPAPP